MNDMVSEFGEEKLEGKDKTLWLKALSAVQLNNQKYAVNLILPVVQNNPGFLEGRQMLRKCQAAGLDGGKEGTVVFGITLGGGSKGVSSKLKSLAKKDPLAAISQIEKELTNDPYSPDLNNLLHDCAAQLAMMGTATFALETIHSNRPDQTKLLHKLAHFYMAENSFTKAASVYHTIANQDPSDSVAIKGEKDCMAKASMMEGTTEVGGALNLKMRDDSLRKELERKSKSGMTKDQMELRRDELLAAYQENQHDLTNVMNLAQTYESLEDYSSSYTFYSWAFELSENDTTVRSKADAMKNKANEQYIKELEAILSQDPNNQEVAAQLQEFRGQALGERILECEARVEENPTDADFRYDLGRAYHEAGRIDDAIPHLQQAKSNPAIETKVLLLLGQTFDAKGMTDMAISQLKRANERLISMDGMKKEVTYQLALMYQKAGNSEEYLKSLKEVYEVDYNYRDVSTRVEDEYNS